MDHFTYCDTALWCESLPASAIAGAVGTPCFVYSQATLVDHYDRLAQAFAPLRPLICYSIKSCSNLAICRLLAQRGAGMDLVSGGELHRALGAGVDPARCVYAGVGKTDGEIAEALRRGVGWMNVESEAEFENLSRIAAETTRPCRAALRVNPDVDPQTHRYTTTGKRRTKFGVDIDRAADFFERYGRDRLCRLDALHLHLGSPIQRTDPFVAGIRKALDLIDELDRRGFPITMLDVGGGFAADYESNQSLTAAQYAADIVPLLEDRVRAGLTIVLEPGRTISANAGVLLVRVLYTKESHGKKFVVCDGGMNVLIRPALYEAFHFIWPADVAPEHVPPRRAKVLDLAGLETVDVVGPICESGDFLAQERALPPLRRGDLLAVFTAGAYGMSMASRYNSMPLPAEVLVDGTRARVIRRRESYHDLTAHESEPTDLAVTVPKSLSPRPSAAPLPGAAR